jgi:hypothetical protein
MERDLMADAAASVVAGAAGSRRLAFVRWVRRMHGWFGLWGAILGLLMGASGIWLNHRNVLKLELPDQRQTNAQLALPDPRPATIEALASWLQGVLKLEREPRGLRVERSRPVPWAERGGDAVPQVQPERWILTFGGPNKQVQVEYWVGNRSASVRTTDNGFVATLTNLHKGVTMPVPWILLIDSLAGSLIFLSLSGTVLWWESHRRRATGVVIFAASIAATLALALWPLQW